MAGDEGVLADIAEDVLAKIHRRNKLSLGFKEVIEDYQRVLRQFKEQAVRAILTELSSYAEDTRQMASPDPLLHFIGGGVQLSAMLESAVMRECKVSGSTRQAWCDPEL